MQSIWANDRFSLYFWDLTADFSEGKDQKRLRHVNQELIFEMLGWVFNCVYLKFKRSECKGKMYGLNSESLKDIKKETLKRNGR